MKEQVSGRSVTGFIILVSDSSSTTFILLPRTPMETYKAQNEDLQMIFIDQHKHRIECQKVVLLPSHFMSHPLTWHGV